jgi:hypothetical protein
MNGSRECVKEGRIRQFWMSPDECRRLCELMEDVPEPDGCHVNIEVGDPMFPDLMLSCVGHCDTPDPGYTGEKCCLQCSHLGDKMIVECSCQQG